MARAPSLSDAAARTSRPHHVHAERTGLAGYLAARFATGGPVSVVEPDSADERGFATFLERYVAALPVEQAVIMVTHDAPNSLATKRSLQPQV